MASSHTSPASDKSLAMKLSWLLVECLVACRAEHALAGKVKAVVASMRSVAIEMVRHSLEEQDGKYRRGEQAVRSPCCRHRSCKARGLKSCTRLTMVGKVRYKRCRYRCQACSNHFFPLDHELGLQRLHAGHSVEFVSNLVLLCTTVPFNKGCELFERLGGFAVSQTLAWKLTHQIGEALYDAEMEQAAQLWALRATKPEVFEPPPHTLRALDRPERIYVMVDNSKVGVSSGGRGRTKRKRGRPNKKKATGGKEGWRDARALIIFDERDMATNASKKRRYILQRNVTAHVGTNEQWYMLCHKAFHENNVYIAKEVVIIADGGNGIWEMMNELLPATKARKVVEVLDWYHAASHIWDVGKILKGVSCQGQPTPAARRWVRGMLDYLAEGMVGNVLQRLRKLKPRSKAAKKEIGKLIDYLLKHRDRLRYAWCRQRGMLIGSGAIESVHKWVLQARLKLPGMRWSLKGINAMIRLRCAWASGTWDDVFRLETAVRENDLGLAASAA